MKKMSYFVFAIIFFYVFCMNTYASSVVVITGTDVRIRNKATTSGSTVLGTANNKDEFPLIDSNSGSAGNGCAKAWYKITYGSNIGYVCSEFASIKVYEELSPEDYKEYSDYLKGIGFPDSYIPSLVSIHEKHPNWNFSVMNVAIDFNTVIKNEYTSSGRSLIEDTGRYYDGYKSTDSWSYNYLNDKFSTNYIGGGNNWYAANKDTIGYYIDPRNFLNEKNIFMFETLSYNNTYHTKDGINKMLKGTFMENAQADSSTKKTYSDAFMDAAVKHNISPYVLISRVIQEVGAKGSTIVSGKVSGYEGYYNFYNIGAYGDSNSSTIINGLKRAKDEGWNTPYKAVIGGAEFLGDDYVSVGQDTVYLNKWDLVGPTYYTHQYMQNIQAPTSESVKTYNGYKNINLLDSNFMFKIPVFKNMPSKTSLPNKGNPNNYLSSLSVNGSYLFSSASTKTDYSMNLSDNTKSVEIAASKVTSQSTVSGTGTISLSGTSQTVPITVTAQNGATRTYTITITRKSDVALSISEILNITNIKNDGKNIYGNNLGTDISTIKKNIINSESKTEVSAISSDGKTKTSGIIATGDKIKIKTSAEEKEYTIVIYGDISGDGKIDKVDAAAILRHYYKYTSYDGAYKEAADVNKDGTIDKVDVAAVLRHLYGYATIKQ